MIHVWHPIGPTQTEVWLYVLVDKEAPPEVKNAIRHSAQRHFSPAGMFEQDDMDNWELSTKAATGTIMRNYPLNYSMGLGHEAWVKGLPEAVDIGQEQAGHLLQDAVATLGRTALYGSVQLRDQFRQNGRHHCDLAPNAFRRVRSE